MRCAACNKIIDLTYNDHGEIEKLCEFCLDQALDALNDIDSEATANEIYHLISGHDGQHWPDT